MTAERTDLRCTITALLAAWVTMVFGTSLLMAALGPLAPAPTSAQELARAVWKGADDTGPTVKVLLIVLFGMQVLGGRHLDPARPGPGLPIKAALGALAMLLTLAVIPESLSCGFGVGLTGARFDAATLPIYLCGAGRRGVHPLGAEVPRGPLAEETRASCLCPECRGSTIAVRRRPRSITLACRHERGGTRCQHSRHRK
jgi:hypothetical protein